MNTSGLLPVHILNTLIHLAVLLVLLPAASLLPTDFLLEPSEKYQEYLVAYVILKLPSQQRQAPAQLWDSAELEKLSHYILKHL